MTEHELTKAVLGEESELSKRIIADLSRGDASWSVFGWHEFLPSELVGIWSKLDLSQRLIAYVCAEERSRNPNAYDE